MRPVVAPALIAVALASSAAWADPDARGRAHAVVPASMRAQQPAAAPSVELLVIEATTGDGGVASTLASLPQLRAAPFNAFPQMRLLSRSAVPLGPSPATAPLPGQRTASITLASRSPGNRFTVNVSFSSGGSIQFVAGVGEPFFTVRTSRADRAIIIGFIVRG